MRKSVTLSSKTPEEIVRKTNHRHKLTRKVMKGVSPSEAVIRNILNYSKALAVMKLHSTGIISMVMN
jgi:hypothetical protein